MKSIEMFKDVMNFINIAFGGGFFGASISRVYHRDYKSATYLLLAVSILFMIGYFTERWSSLRRR